ncbi:NAD-dependent epimerase/dehydratase family protein [Haloechinothrix sp. LS1_15]|uniref:NAD-dependent epimerase/dehydratase family protein n=1 Tax=Haloechinothrix sp. LS1_15 TaxID=2652248 RepID=UPI002945D6FC|nr:NAD-dependent epimerase/dehydratase family protein [Haloechinothrix sp. LS1_15]MDV6012359.1 NAD-dependent epimerase/dehydratase family protein [Haloechinothrix sp. LS1_15]
MTAKRVFFTGGAGFIASHTIPLLLERGYAVRIYDNMRRGDRERTERFIAESGGRVELVEKDVTNGGPVREHIAGCTHVIHFPTMSINKSIADPHESIYLNMIGNNNVFAAAADEGVRRLVFASTASVYGNPKKLPMHEDDELEPLTPYCISKRAGEDLLGFYQRHKGLSWNALRFFNVYGPGQKVEAYYTSVINHFLQRLRAGQPPVIDGKGEQSMDFVHVHDIARAVVAALESERCDMPINIGTGIDTSISTLAKLLIDAVGADVEPQFNPRDVLVARRAANIDRARNVLGWEPTITVEQGMADLVAATASEARDGAGDGE